MSARANLFQVVTFATDPLHGNPAFVLSGARDASDHVLTTACAMLRTDIVAVVGEASGGEAPLRFFTTEGPMPAPATRPWRPPISFFATAWRRQGRGPARSHFIWRTATAARRISRANASPSISRPCRERRVDRVAEMEAALGARPRETWVAPFGYVAIFDDPGVIAEMRPDMALVSGLRPQCGDRHRAGRC